MGEEGEMKGPVLRQLNGGGAMGMVSIISGRISSSSYDKNSNINTQVWHYLESIVMACYMSERLGYTRTCTIWAQYIKLTVGGLSYTVPSLSLQGVHNHSDIMACIIISLEVFSLETP